MPLEQYNSYIYSNYDTALSFQIGVSMLVQFPALNFARAAATPSLTSGSAGLFRDCWSIVGAVSVADARPEEAEGRGGARFGRSSDGEVGRCGG